MPDTKSEYSNYYQMAEPFPLSSSRFLHKDATKMFPSKLAFQQQQQQQPDYYLTHKAQSMSKYHYHLKLDNIYGDKKLKLCGLCMTPGNLVQDLRQLSRLSKKTNLTTSNGTVIVENFSKSSEQNPIFLNKITRNSMHSTFMKLNNDSSTDNAKIEFDVLDLSTDRSSGMNLPILNLPSDLFRFPQLRRLHLDGNQIKVIPDEFGEKLINLEVLTMSGNNLKLFPQSIKNLSKLFSIHLANNKFETFPEVVCLLLELKFVDFCSNRLVNVSASVKNLKNLETLLLFDNRIAELPASIGGLCQLRTLWLGNNQLKKLPKSICELNNLDWDELVLSSNVNNNPLKEPPYDVCTQGLNSIRSYFNPQDKK